MLCDVDRKIKRKNEKEGGDGVGGDIECGDIF